MGHTQSSCIGRPDDSPGGKGGAASPEDRVSRPVGAEARSNARKTVTSVDAALAASHGDLLLVVGEGNDEEENDECDECDDCEPDTKRVDMDVVGMQPTVSTPTGDNPSSTSDNDTTKAPLNATSTSHKTDDGKARSFRVNSAPNSSGTGSRRQTLNSDAALSVGMTPAQNATAHSHVSFWSRLVGRRQHPRNGGTARRPSLSTVNGPSRSPIGQRIHNRFRGVRGASDDSSPTTMLSMQDSMAASAPPPSAVGASRRTRRHRIGASAFWRRRGGMGTDVAGGRAAAGVGVGPDGRLRISSFARDQFFSPHAPGDFGGVVEAGFELMGDKAARTKLIVRDCTENDRCYSAGNSFGRQIFAVRYRAEPEPDVPESTSQDTSDSPTHSDDSNLTPSQDSTSETPELPTQKGADVEDGNGDGQQPDDATSALSVGGVLDSGVSLSKRKRDFPSLPPPKEDNTVSSGGESRVDSLGDASRSRPDTVSGVAGLKEPPAVDEELRRPRPNRRQGSKTKQQQRVLADLHGEADFVDYAIGDMGTSQARLMMNKLPPSMTGAHSDSRGRSLHHTSSSMRFRHSGNVSGGRAIVSGGRMGGGSALGNGTTPGAIIGPSLDRGLVDVPKGCASYLFTPEAVRTTKVKPVDDFICVDPQCEIYVCDIGLTSAQCNKIIEVTERCSRGNYAAYTYAKQTLGCRDYDELALICEWPVMRACETIKARLNGEEAKPESAQPPDGDGSKKEGRTEKMELILDDREPHMVKYDVTRKERQKLDMHTDKSEWTFLIALSEGCGVDYDGGGTYFEAIDSVVHLQKGHALIFPGRLRHRGQKITRGLRFLLVGFLIDRNAVDKDWTKPIPQIRK